MAIDPISTATSALRALPSLPSVPTTDHASATTDVAGGFGDMVAGAIDNLNGLQHNADQLAIQAATGDLTDVHEYTIAASEAEIATQLTVAVRDKAVEAFNDIMRMQV